MPLPSKLSLFRPYWTVIWMVGAVIHLTQAIWFSSWQAVPGGLGDGRFNHLVLEHGYLSLLGYYDWLSPGQFYPVTHTLGWSDTHLGTLPIYLIPRLLGASPHLAWQLWFVICATLNLITGYQLLRKLGVSSWWLGPTLFAAFAGSITVWMVGIHPQLLPVFPALWAFSNLLGYLRSKERWQFFAFIGGMLWQMAAAPYLAFFTGLFGLGVIALQSISVGKFPFREFATPSAARPPKPGLILLTLAGAGLGLISIWIYVTAIKSGQGRPFQEVIDLAPTWASWFSSSPVSVWYPTAWPAHVSDHSEQVLFSGFLPWVLGAFAIGLGWKNRRDPLGRSIFGFGAAAMLTVLFFVRWPNGFSCWLMLAEWFEPLRAFRASGRVAIFTHMGMVIAGGLLLSGHLLKSWKPGTRLLLLLVLVGEGLTYQQPRYQITEAQNRIDAIRTAWASAGDRPILAFAPGHTNQLNTHLQLDAWATALATRRHTLNGYSGGSPTHHTSFLWNPDESQARGLQQSLNIPADQISFVTQLSPSDAKSTGYEFLESQALQFLHDFDLQPTQWELFSPLESFTFEDQVYYQFTPPSVIRFELPDSTNEVEFLNGLRPGAFNNGGDSDGYSLNLRVETNTGTVLSESEEFINPRDNADQRGFLPLSYSLPSGSNRVMVITLGPGPDNSNAWDWPLIGRLRLQ